MTRNFFKPQTFSHFEIFLVANSLNLAREKKKAERRETRGDLEG
jgi:hypothetical protein